MIYFGILGPTKENEVEDLEVYRRQGQLNKDAMN